MRTQFMPKFSWTNCYSHQTRAKSLRAIDWVILLQASRLDETSALRFQQETVGSKSEFWPAVRYEHHRRDPGEIEEIKAGPSFINHSLTWLGLCSMRRLQAKNQWRVWQNLEPKQRKARPDLTARAATLNADYSGFTFLLRAEWTN